MATKFTVKMIDNLKPKVKRYVVREGDGFAIRVFPSGKKAWYLIYTFDGKRKWFSLGAYPAVSLEKARQLYRDALSALAHGIDPGAAEREAKEARRKEPTVEALADEYMKKWAKPRKRSWKEDLRNLEKDILPAWKDRKISDITRRDAILLLESIVERGAPIQSNNVLEVARRMFNFAVERSMLEHSPFTGIKPLGKKVSRNRVLSAEEIKTLWDCLDDPALTMSNEIRRALKLILVTGQRPGECIGIHWREIDGHWWTIPAERAKNGREHRVYLTDLALSLLGPPGEGYTFPSPRRIKPDGSKAAPKPIDPNAVPFALRRNFKEDDEGQKKLPLDHFTPHDLRRTAATQLAELGFSGEIIGKVLNHVDRSVTAMHYNRHDYDREKQRALEAWDRKLDRILHGKNEDKVIDLRQG